MKQYQVQGVDQQALIRQLQRAGQLSAAQSPEGQMVSGFYVAPSVTQRLATIAKQLSGDKMSANAEQMMREAEAKRQADRIFALTGKRPGQPAQPQQQAQPNVDAVMNQPMTQQEVDMSFDARQAQNRQDMGLPMGGYGQAQPISQPVRQPGVQTGPQINPERQAMIDRMLSSGDPALQQRGMEMMIQDQQYLRSRRDQLGDRQDERGYQGQVRQETFGQQKDLAYLGNELAMGRQGQQNQFTAEQNAAQRAHAERLARERNQLQRESNDAAQALKNATTQAAATKAQTDLTVSLRKEINALDESKNIRAMLPAQRSAQDAMQRNTAVADMNMIYAMAKIFDPTSVVREGEYASVNSSQSYTDRMKGLVSFLQGGGRITPEHRQRLMDEINSRTIEAQKAYQTALQPYQQSVQAYQLDPNLVFPSMGELAGTGYSSGNVGGQPQAANAPPKVLRFDAQGNPVQ